MLIHGAELPQSHKDRPPVDGGLVQDTTLSKTTERRLFLVSTNVCSPAKRARLGQGGNQKRTDSIMPAISVEKLKHYTEPPRRSARLQEQQHPSSAVPICPRRVVSRRQIEAGAGTSKPERAGLTQTKVTKVTTSHDLC